MSRFFRVALDCVLFTFVHNLFSSFFRILDTLWLVEVVLACEFLLIPTFSYATCLLLTSLSFGMIQLVTYRHKASSHTPLGAIDMVIRSLPPKHLDRVTINSQMLKTVFSKMLRKFESFAENHVKRGPTVKNMHNLLLF